MSFSTVGYCIVQVMYIELKFDFSSDTCTSIFDSAYKI